MVERKEADGDTGSSAGDVREPGAQRTGPLRDHPAFAAAVRGEREVLVDRIDAVLALEVIEAAERSAAAGNVASLDAWSAAGARADGRLAHGCDGARRGADLASSRVAVGVEDDVTGWSPRPGRAASGAGRRPRAAPADVAAVHLLSRHLVARAADSGEGQSSRSGCRLRSASDPSQPGAPQQGDGAGATANGEAPSAPFVRASTP